MGELRRPQPLRKSTTGRKRSPRSRRSWTSTSRASSRRRPPIRSSRKIAPTHAMKSTSTSPNSQPSQRTAGARAKSARRGPPGPFPGRIDRGQGGMAPADRSRYAGGPSALLRGESAEIVDVAKTLAAGRVVCARADVALVGLHIVIKTKSRPQWIWSSFEHIDNVPPAGAGEAREPDARDAGAPYSYFDPSKPNEALASVRCARHAARRLEQPAQTRSRPMQVVRRYPIHPSTMALNRAYWALPGIKGTVWEHYMLVAAQWPTVTRPTTRKQRRVFSRADVSAGRAARELPDSRRAQENLVNTTIETYMQDPPSSCMSCHQAVSNARGRDFVGVLAGFR